MSSFIPTIYLSSTYFGILKDLHFLILSKPRKKDFYKFYFQMVCCWADFRQNSFWIKWGRPFRLRDLTVNWSEHGASGRRGTVLVTKGQSPGPGPGTWRSRAGMVVFPAFGAPWRLQRESQALERPGPAPSHHSALYKYSGAIYNLFRSWDAPTENPRSTRVLQPPLAGGTAVWTRSVWF